MSRKTQQARAPLSEGRGRSEVILITLRPLRPLTLLVSPLTVLCLDPAMSRRGAREPPSSRPAQGATTDFLPHPRALAAPSLLLRCHPLPMPLHLVLGASLSEEAPQLRGIAFEELLRMIETLSLPSHLLLKPRSQARMVIRGRHRDGRTRKGWQAISV